jgi:hypothetical protein
VPQRLSSTPKPEKTAAGYWLSQVEKAFAYVDRLKAVPSLSGEEWTRKNINHLKGRLGVLLAQPPPGVQKHIRGFRKRLKSL